MLTINGAKTDRFCDGQSRRSFLRIGALGIGGISLDTLLRAKAFAKTDHHEPAVIMIYLPGGPTQHETFDPKPGAAEEIRGAFRSIATRASGTRFCELLPKLAAISDQFSIVRTLVGMQNRHESFQCYTGRPGGQARDNEPSGGWPSIGSVLSHLYGPNRHGVVPFVDAAPKMGHMPYNNRGFHDPPGRLSWPGFTGMQHTPFVLEGEGKHDLVLNNIDMIRLEHRRQLLDSLAIHQTTIDRVANQPFREQAFSLLTSNRFARAMNLENEPQTVRDRYGAVQGTHSSFGGAPQDPQRLLLARRLVEAGVRCVTISFGAWDWHANREGTIEFLAKKYLPVFDHALSTLLQDLCERGLLERVTVVVLGEFGRTPRINSKGGRDHWPNTQSVLLAGGGIQGGRTVGTTDRSGGTPVDRPVHIQEVFATLYRNLGIDVNSVTINDLGGRPRFLVDENRQPIEELY